MEFYYLLLNNNANRKRVHVSFRSFDRSFLARINDVCALFLLFFLDVFFLVTCGFFGGTFSFDIHIYCIFVMIRLFVSFGTIHIYKSSSHIFILLLIFLLFFFVVVVVLRTCFYFLFTRLTLHFITILHSSLSMYLNLYLYLTTFDNFFLWCTAGTFGVECDTRNG